MDLCVLMSVYNGSKYLTQQLDSIFSQETGCRIRVLLRDDCSSDGSVALVKRYAREKGREITVIEGENLGPAASFFSLIRQCPEADFYAFSDQDDVWLPGKVEAAAPRLSSASPVLWLSNFHVTDENLAVMKSCALKKPETDPARILFYNNVPGCVMMFNRALLIAMRELDMQQFRMHDILALDVAALVGEIVFDERPFLLYRQHQSNALGFGNKKIRVGKWLRDKLRLLKAGEDYHVADYAARALQCFGDRLRREDRDRLGMIAAYKEGLFQTLRLLRSDFTHDGFNRTSVSIRCKIALRYF